MFAGEKGRVTESHAVPLDAGDSSQQLVMNSKKKTLYTLPVPSTSLPKLISTNRGPWPSIRTTSRPTKPNHLPLILLTTGLSVKAFLILVWRIFDSRELLRALIVFDPASVWLSEKMTAFLFDSRRLAPTYAEIAVYELFLVIGFGLECFILGVLAAWLLRRFPGGSSSSSTATRS